MQLIRALIVVAAAGSALLVPGIALGHNAAHLELPNGACVSVGSGKDQTNPQVDHIAGPGDQYGARWASDASHPGNNPLSPRFCEEVSLTSQNETSRPNGTNPVPGAP